MNTIDGSFRESVRAYPDAVAIKYYQDQRWEQLTYADLDSAVTITAAGLMAKGITRESRVAIMSENLPEWIICYLAIISAGAVAVPIDALLGEDEAEHILNHSVADTIICSMSCNEVINRILSRLNALNTIIIFDRKITVRNGQETSGSGRKMAEKGRKNIKHKQFVSYEDIRDIGAEKAAAGDVPFPEKTVSDIASILYTSGTTGASKGVILTHKNFMSNVIATESVLTIGVEDNFILLLPLHHTFPFTICMVIPLTRGSSISFVDILSRNRQRLI